MKAPKPLSEKAVAMVKFLQANLAKDYTMKEVATGMGITPNTVTGTFNGLVAKGFAVRVPLDLTVDEKPVTVQLLKLTDAGKALTLA